MKKWCLFFFLVLFFLHSSQTVCLNMIVKDESRVIARCLESVKPYLDYWVIVDTGSTDGTQKIIKEVLKGIPGELHEQKWVNFGYNRNEALKLAKGKGDYLLFIDADEVLKGTFKKKFTHDVYLAPLQTSPDQRSLRALLINNHRDWKWHGVLHESLEYEDKRSFEVFKEAIISAETKDGNRSQDPDKYLKDAKILENALLDEPNNPNYVYYLAQSYYNAKKLSLALKYYEKRANMGGWDQHVFWSKYYIGHLQELLGLDSELIIKSYCDAFQYRPTRAEPIFKLANHFYQQKNYFLGYLLAQFGKAIPLPDDFVYVEHYIYSYGMLAIFANCALEMGKYEEALSGYEKILQQPNIPASVQKEALSTIAFLQEKIQIESQK